MNLTNFRFETDADGIATATWDMPGRSMNVITPEVMAELDQIIDKVAADEAIKGCVITSGKESLLRRRRPHHAAGPARPLCRAGARRRARRSRCRPSSTRAASSRCSIASSRPAGSPSQPRSMASASAAPSNWRSPASTASSRDDASTRVGLPEIKVGLFPGAGGTQRVSRLMQTGDALQMMFKGEQIKALPARNSGLVHAVVPRDELVQKAKDWLKANPQAKAPWDDPKFKLPSNKVYSPAGMQIWPPANAIYRRETNDNYPAARAILSAVYEGLQLPIDLGLKVESRYFAKILRTKEAASMIRSLFVSMQELNKGARRPADVPASRLKKVGVVGAGFMGAGIAYVTAQAGIEVVLIDRDMEAAEKGKAYSHKLVSDQIMKGRAKTADRDALLARITATRRLCRPQGLRPRHRGRVRGSEGQGRGHRQGRGRDRPGGDLRLQHLDPADHRPRRARASGRRTSSASISSRRSRRCCWSRSSWRRRPATRRSPWRSTSSAPSGRRRSSSTTRAASTPIAASATTSAKAT